MDTKTLLIAALAVSLATSLCMAIIFWTRRTYSGFGLWVAGHFCLVVSVALFILPRDHFPPWLTIILANYLWFASVMLNNRGILVFRGRRMGYSWEIAASVSFCALFMYFTYREPNIAARLTVIALYHGGFQLWTVAVLLMRRPAYFGSSDVLQVVSLGILLAINIMRSGSLWVSVESIPHQVIALQPFIDMILLCTIVVMLMLTVSQIIMNTQRLEYDYRIAQERLDLALDGSNTGLYAAHLLTGETFVDERHQRLLGYRPGEVVFAVRNWLEHVHPQDQPALLERYEEVAKGSRPTFESEYRVRHRDGTWRWVLDRGKSFDPDALGCPRQVTGTLMDITERKQMENALRESTEKFRLAFDNANTGMCLVDLKGQILRVNSKMSAIFGYSTSQLERMNVNDLALSEDTPISPHFIHEAVEGDLDSATFEKRYRHQQGHVIYGQVSSSLVRDIEGHPWYFISQVQDITQRKQAEAALNQTKMALEEAQRLAKVGSWDWEMATDTVTWSRELYRILDCDPAQPAPTYQQHSQLYTADSMACLEAAVTQAVAYGTPYEVDLERIQPDGSSQWIIGRGEPQYDAQRRIVGLRGTCMDITERHRLEEALREQAIRDPLTGLFNRRYLDETLVRELHRCQRNAQLRAISGSDARFGSLQALQRHLRP